MRMNERFVVWAFNDYMSGEDGWVHVCSYLPARETDREVEV